MGKLTVMPAGPGLDWHITNDREFFVATDARAFEGWTSIAKEHKPGEFIVAQRWHDDPRFFRMLHCRADLLPAHVEVLKR